MKYDRWVSTIRDRARRFRLNRHKARLAERRRWLRLEVLESRLPLAVYVSGDVPKSITDNTTITSDLIVADSGTIADVNVTLDITHTFDGDLDVFLIAPDSTRIELFTAVGGSNEDFSGTTLDDEAATPIASGSAPFSGTFSPEGALSDLDGKSMTGTWQLEISDTAGGDEGTLNSWSLDIAETGSGSDLLYLTSLDFPVGRLHSYNLDTAVLTEINPSTTEFLHIDYSPTGDLYGVSGSKLYTIDTTTGATTEIAETKLGSVFIYPNGMTFKPDGTLYIYEGSTRTGSFKHFLHTVDLGTGAVTQVAEITGVTSIYGIEYGNGVLYAGYENALYSINTSSGAATLIGAGSTSWDLDYGDDGVMRGTDPGSPDRVVQINLNDGSSSTVTSSSSVPFRGIASSFGVGGGPEIDVQGNGQSIGDGDTTPSTSDHTDFGNADVSSGSVVRTFTIENTGTATLNLSGATPVTISGAHAADFSVTQPALTVIPASGTTTFQVTFDPSATGTRTATINIANDDSDENPYDFAVQGDGTSANNDDFANRFNLGSVASVTDTGTNIGFTGELGEPPQSGAVNSAWWSWTAPSDGTLDVDTNGSDFDTYLTLATGGSFGSMSVLQQDDDGGNGTQSRIIRAVTSGITYQIAVDGYQSSTGSVTLNLSFASNAGPEINVQGNSVTIVDGDATPSTSDQTDFGSVNVSSGTVVRTFTIQNTGDTTLNLAGVTPVTVSGGNAGDFSITQPVLSAIPASGSTTFQVTFDPSAAGVRSTTINIANDDADENPYDFAIEGFGTAPEINVQGNSVSIVDGDTTPSTSDDTDFGSVNLSSGTVVRTFTIQNTGDATLNLSGVTPVTISGGNASDFSVTQPSVSSIAPSGSTTFQVTFDPSAAGVRTTTVNIASDDADENPYNFAIEGFGLAPEINVQGNGLSIVDGDTTPAASDHTDFGTISVASGTVVRTFTIENTGDAALNLTGGSPVTVSGTNAGDFSVTQPLLLVIPASGSTTFQVTFDPSAAGARTATINVASDDADEDPYDFAIEGNGFGAPVMDAEPAKTVNTTNTVSWSAVAGADEYFVEYDTSDSFASPDGDSGWITGTSHTFTGLTPGQTYYYRAKARQVTPGATAAWTQTTQAEFNTGTLVDTTANAGGDVELATSGFSATEHFDESGSTWTNTIFPEEVVTFGDATFARETLTGVTGAPNTTPALPINQAGDLEGRYFEVATAGSSSYALMADTAGNVLTDATIDGYLGIGHGSDFALPGAGLMLRTSVTPEGKIDGYRAEIHAGNTSVSSASLVISAIDDNIQAYTIEASQSFSVDTDNEVFRLVFSATGTTLTASLSRVSVVAGSVVETPIDLSSSAGMQASISDTDSLYADGRAGVSASARDQNSIFFDDISVTAPGSSSFVTTGTITSPLITPSPFDAWTTLDFTSATPTNTALTVDVLNDVGGVLAAGVASGTNLNTLGITASTIKLRANLSTSDTAVTPTLSDWTVNYQSTPDTFLEGGFSNSVSSQQVAAETSVSIDGAGNLLIDDVNVDSDDALTISTDGANIIISDPNVLLETSIAGATGHGSSTISVPLATAGFTGGIIVNTMGGDDSLTVDFSGGNFSKTITYNGGSQTTSPSGDSLTLQGGGTFASADFAFANANDGSIDVAGNATITYTGLEPITSSIAATDVTLQYSAASETITLSDAGGGSTTVDSTAGEVVTFASPTGTLTIHGGDGADTIEMNSLAAGYGAHVVVDGQGGSDTANIKGSIALGGGESILVNADIINLPNAASDLATSGSGSVILTADRNILLSSGSSLSTVDGGIILTANVAETGTGTFRGIEANNATIQTTGIGDIVLTGTGGNVAGSFPSLLGNYGVQLRNGTSISSSATGASAGAITITGFGGDSADYSFGVYLRDSTTDVTSVDGAIAITGQGGGAGSSNYGVFVNGIEKIESTGTGASAATITINGTGGQGAFGSSVGSNHGVYLSGSTTVVTSSDGDILIVGNGGNGAPDGGGQGVRIQGIGAIASTGLDSNAANILIDGSGGLGFTPTSGVVLSGSTTDVTSDAGDILIIGEAGNGISGSGGAGVEIASEATIQATTGSVVVTGTTADDNSVGVRLSNASGGRLLSLGSGSITINAVGSGSQSDLVAGADGVIGGALAAGPITINADSMALSGTLNLQSSGALTIKPQTASTNINLGAGAANSGLQLDDTELALLADGFVSITIGDAAAGTGAVDIGASTFQDPISIIGGSIDVAGLNAGTNDVTLVARSGSITDGNAASDIIGGTVTLDGNVTPGQSPGVLAVSGDVNLVSGDTLSVEIGGATPGTSNTNHDQIDVTGMVTIGTGVTLNVTSFNGYVPTGGESFTIINNDGVDAVVGSFSGLGEGASISNFLGSGLSAVITYAGGTNGNDVVLTVNSPANVTTIGDAGVNATAGNSDSRSGIASITLDFSDPVTVAGVTSLSLWNHTTSSGIDLSGAALSGNGTAQLSWDLSSLNLPDGNYSAELAASEFQGAHTHAFHFHVLAADGNGNRAVDIPDYLALLDNFGSTGGAPYDDGDFTGDGDVNIPDYLLLLDNFGKTLAPLAFDFGDAPEAGTSFPTTLANNGAYHAIGSGLFLGTAPDGEADGQPSSAADGDVSGIDDEDGISFGTLEAGSNASLSVMSTVPSGSPVLNGWIDFNADGDWDDPGEQVLTNQVIVDGLNTPSISIPAGATVGNTYARFRLTNTADYSYVGFAPDGEVEDYQVTIIAAPGGGSELLALLDYGSFNHEGQAFEAMRDVHFEELALEYERAIAYPYPTTEVQDRVDSSSGSLEIGFEDPSMQELRPTPYSLDEQGVDAAMAQQGISED